MNHQQIIKHLMVVGNIETENSEKGELYKVFKRINEVNEDDGKNIRDIYIVILNGDNDTAAYEKLVNMVKNNELNQNGESILPSKKWEEGMGLKFKAMYENKEYMIHLTNLYPYHLISRYNGYTCIGLTSFVFIKDKKKSTENNAVVAQYGFIEGSKKFMLLLNEEPYEEKIKIQEMSIKWNQKTIEEEDHNEDFEKEKPEKKMIIQQNLGEEFGELENDFRRDENNDLEVVSILLDDGKYLNEEDTVKERLLENYKRKEDEEEGEVLEDWTFLEVEKNEDNKDFYDLVKFNVDEVIETNWHPQNINSTLKHIIEKTIMSQDQLMRKSFLKREFNIKSVSEHIHNKDFCCFLIFLLAIFTSVLFSIFAPVYVLIITLICLTLAIFKVVYYLFKSNKPLPLKILLIFPYIIIITATSFLFFCIGMFASICSMLCCAVFRFSFASILKEGCCGVVRLITLNFDDHRDSFCWVISDALVFNWMRN
eukprot:TRINITY_DN832_c0_g2_i1.p1 TRINITY_DN832_c0_g2~~TRINITY_DN832_c0_g2_i1.p1  ORF type:complete len:529 (+),score=137.30 TRINITY_DN832_c0_g2_i1:143-1588(+)